MKSLQMRRTPGSCDECRMAPDGRQPLDQAHRLEPLARNNSNNNDTVEIPWLQKHQSEVVVC